MPRGHPTRKFLVSLSPGLVLLACWALNLWLVTELKQPLPVGLVGNFGDPPPPIAAPFRHLDAQLTRAKELQHSNHPEAAQASYEAALRDIDASSAPAQLRGRALDGLGSVSQDLGDFYRGLSLHLQARDIFRRQGQNRKGLRDLEAEALHNIGTTYNALGDEARAKDYLTLAFDGHTSPWRRAITLTELATLNDLNGDCEAAIENFREAFTLRMAGCNQSLKDKLLGKSVLLDRLASAATNCQDFATAERAYQSSSRILQALSDDPGNTTDADAKDRRSYAREQAVALANLGVLYTRQGRSAEAVHKLRAALDRLPSDFFAHDRAIFEFRLAEALRQAGQVDAARQALETSIRLSNALQRATPTTVLRTSYAARHHVFRQELIDLHLERLEARRAMSSSSSQNEEASDLGGEALLLASQARANDLLQRLTLRSGVASVAASAAQRQGTLLEQQLRALEHQRLVALQRLGGSVAEGSASLESIAALETRQRQLIFQLQALHEPSQGPPSSGSTTVPRTLEAAMTPPPGFDLATLRQLLDDDTLVLAYWLGDRRSALWQMDRQRLRTYILPPRREIEALAQEVIEDFAASDQLGRTWDTDALDALSRTLLPPEADDFGNRRLAIIADGRLLQLPFAALRRTGAEHPLVAEHEIIYLPSLPVLAALRQRGASSTRRPFPSATVFADALYRPPSRAAVAPASDGLVPPSPLPFSRREAKAIERWLGEPPQGQILLRGEASRERLLAGDLPSRAVLHLSLHGELDTERPEFSHLVFSLWDDDGRPTDGRLYVHELDGLDLSCDLLVLSACNSARGKVFRGEGLVGMPFAALGAGAQRALVSLWSVDDAATAALMEAFYSALFEQRLPPAAALRQAQRQLFEPQDGPWRSPYYWAGFVLYGDWRWSVAD